MPRVLPRMLLPFVSLALLIVSLCSAGAAHGALTASSAGVTITSPSDGRVISGDFDGPIKLTFEAAQAGTYEIDVALSSGCIRYPGTSACSSSTSIAVDGPTAAGGAATVTLPDRLARDGQYELIVTAPDGSQVTSGFTLKETWNDTVGWVRVQTPPDGSNIWMPEEGDTIPVVLRFKNYPSSGPRVFNVAYEGPHGHIGSEEFRRGDSDNLGFRPSGLGEHRVIVTDADGVTYAESTFQLIRPPVIGRTTTPSGARFYPLVQDGYRDVLTLANWLYEPVRLTWSIENADGRTVRGPLTTSVLSTNRSRIKWDGRDNNGNLVPKGTYTATVTGAAEDGFSTTRTKVVRVATTTVTSYRTKRLSGWDYATRKVSGGCTVRHNQQYGMTVYCPYGGVACFTYRLRLPAEADPGRFDTRLWRWGPGWNKYADYWDRTDHRRGVYSACVYGSSKYAIEAIWWKYSIERRI